MRVRTPTPKPLGEAIASHGGSARHLDPVTLEVHGLDLPQVGHLAFVAGVELHELAAQAFDLEDLFFQLTSAAPPGPAMLPSQGDER